MSDMLYYLTANQASRLSVSEVCRRLQSNPTQGLTVQEVEHRKRLHGLNEFVIGEEDPWWMKYLEQFKNPLICLLLVSALVSACMRQVDDAISITLAILIVVTVAFVQEYRSEKSLQELNKLVPHQCTCSRLIDLPASGGGGGTVMRIPAKDLVPGDVVSLGTGDRVPADLRLTSGSGLAIDESSFTGETEPARKCASDITDSDCEEGTKDKRMVHSRMTNIAFMGTLVRCGNGIGVVIGTGQHTEFGEIFKMMQAEQTPKTPLQKSMDRLGKQLSFYSFLIIALIMILGYVQGRALLEMFTIGVSLAVAAIPEGLPIVVTVTLALGVIRMAKRKAIVKKLPTVETLGCVNVICSDKTGTLTKNEMTVTDILASDGTFAKVTGIGYTTPGHLQLLNSLRFEDSDTSALSPLQAVCKLVGSAGLCCNASFETPSYSLLGLPTEGAILVCASKLLKQTHNAGSDVRDDYRRLKEVPFSSERKYMEVECSLNETGARVLVIKGAPEMVLPKCNRYYNPSGLMKAGPLNGEFMKDGMPRQYHSKHQTSSPSQEFIKSAQKWVYDAFDYPQANFYPTLEACTKQRFIESANAMARSGLRILAIAYDQAALDSNVAFPSNTDAYDKLIFLGFLGIKDPLKENIPEIVAALNDIGVQMKIITGDSRETACSVAESMNLAYKESNLLSGTELEHLSEWELSRIIEKIVIFYRTSPVHKIKIVKALQSANYVVGMTGDGVNDAVALRKADIGIAMGAQGTDVCKEASDMILVDDDFSTILMAIEEGKTIYGNIQNFLRFQLSTSISALSLIALSTLFKVPSPLNAMQILWINIIMDGPPAQSLGVEPVDDEIVKKLPRNVKQSMITKDLLINVIIAACTIILGTTWVFLREMRDGKITPRDTTMTFTCFVLFDMFNALSCRSQEKSVFSIGLFGNRFFVWAVAGSLFAQVLVVYVPFFQKIFVTEAIGIMDWIFLIVLSSTVFWVSEFKKLVCRCRCSSSDPYSTGFFSGRCFEKKPLKDKYQMV